MTTVTYRVKPSGGAVALASLTLLVLEGCGSSPKTRFYTLSPVAAPSRVEVTEHAPVKISAVHIPAVLDRNSIVRSEANHQLDISSKERWGADLGEMIRRTLTQDLQQRLPEGMVIAPQSPAPENARGLVVDVLSFGPDASGNVTLEATWTLQAGSPPQVVTQRTAHLTDSSAAAHQPANDEGSASAAAQAAAMSALLGRLADDIAHGLSHLSEP